jgi:methionyl-tRNA formyltransferase
MKILGSGEEAVRAGGDAAAGERNNEAGSGPPARMGAGYLSFAARRRSPTTSMSVVFMGMPEFAAGLLKILARTKHRPELVVTRPDDRGWRGDRAVPTPVSVCASQLGLRLVQPEDVNDLGARVVMSHLGRADLDREVQSTRQAHTVVVCGYSTRIGEQLLSEHEFLNVHPSLLPRWRGPAPIERAIIAGDATTGVSIIRMNAGLDTGPICLSRATAVRRDDCFASLSARLQKIAAEAVLQVIRLRKQGNQQDETMATYAPRITSKDRMLDLSRPVAELERIVRALHPHIGARLMLGRRTSLVVRRALVVDEFSRPKCKSGGGDAAAESTRIPRLVDERERLLIVCKLGKLELLEVEPVGAPAMTGSEYLRTYGLPRTFAEEAPRSALL